MWTRTAAWLTAEHRLSASKTVQPLRIIKWLSIIWIMVFWRLGYVSLLDPDEAHYAQLTREMLTAKSWLVPLLDGSPFIDKPVLFHWLQAASLTLFGDTEFGVRLPTALAAVGAIAVTRWAGTNLFGVRVGRWAAAMFATLPATFALASVALFDMTFTLFLFGGIAGLTARLAGRADRRSETLAFVSLALAVMTKGPVALLLVALWLLITSLIDVRVRRRLAIVGWGSGLLLVLVLAAPWFVWMYVRFGQVFVGRYLIAGNLLYFTQPVHFSSRTIEHTYYARVFLGAFFPCSIIALARLLQAIPNARDGSTMSVAEICLWTWVVSVVGFFSLARFKLDHYVFPAAPALALISAATWLRAGQARHAATMVVSVAVVALTLAVAGVVLALFMYRIDLGLDGTAMLLPVTMVGTAVAMLIGVWRSRRAVPATPVTMVGGLLAVYAAIVFAGLPVLETTRPMATIARRLARWSAPDIPVALYGLERWQASLRYYVNRPVVLLESPEALRAFVARNPEGRVVMSRRDLEMLQGVGIPIDSVYERRGVIGTTGRGLRRQLWGSVVITTGRAAAKRLLADADSR